MSRRKELLRGERGTAWAWRSRQREECGLEFRERVGGGAGGWVGGWGSGLGSVTRGLVDFDLLLVARGHHGFQQEMIRLWLCCWWGSTISCAARAPHEEDMSVVQARGPGRGAVARERKSLGSAGGLGGVSRAPAAGGDAGPKAVKLRVLMHTALRRSK